MNKLQEFYEMASNPQISTKEVRKRLKELKEEGLIHGLDNPPIPKDEDLVFIEGKKELFWKHMVEENSFSDIFCWTDGVILGIPKNNVKAIEYICQLLQGKIVAGWANV